MIFYVVSLLKSIIIVFCGRFFFDIWEQKNEPQLCKKRVFTVIAVVGLFVCSWIPETIFGVRILAEIVILTISMFFYKDLEFRNTLYLTIYYFVFVWVLGYVALYFENAFALSEKPKGALLSALLSLFFTFLLFPVVCLLKGIMKRRAAMVSLRKEWIAFMIFPLFTVAFIGWLVSGWKMPEWGMLVVLVVLLFGNITLFYIFSDLTKKQKLLIKERVLKKELERNLEAFGSVNQALEQQRSRSHEFKNYINCIYYMVELKQYDELQKFVHSVRSNMHTKEEAIYHTGNLLVDAILNAKYKEALAKDIQFDVEVDCLEHLFIKDEDVVVILSNLLNNAMEATGQLEENRHIILSVKVEEDGVRIITENTHCNTMETDGDRILTSKLEDDSNHGYGIQNVKNSVAKYDGDCDISYTENKFVLNIFLHKKS